MSWDYALAGERAGEEDVAAVLDCLRSGWLTLGPRTQEFEAEFAEHLGVPHAIAMSSCTSALHLGYLAAGIGPGDEVIVPGITFVATGTIVVASALLASVFPALAAARVDPMTTLRDV